MEIEAKFRIAKHIKASAIEHIDWTPYHLGPRVVHALRDTLLDNADRAITGSKHALRVREDGLHTYLTFKGPPQGEGGLHRREEREEQIDPAVVGKPQAWPSTILEQVVALVPDLALEPIVEVHNKRRSWQLWQGEHVVAELSLDRGKIRAGGRTESLHEIEIELKEPGTEDDLAHLVERLKHALPLADEPRTKLARGLSLLGKKAKGKAPAITMTPTADLAEAGRAVLRKHWSKLLKNEDGARTGDVEAVHDMRVATRRMRAMLEVLMVVYEQRTVERLRKGLKRLAAALGVVRDADVWIEAVEAYGAGRSPEEQADLTPLIQTLVEQRASGRRKLMRELESKRMARLRNEVAAFVDSAGAGVRADAMGLRVRDRAGSALWARYEELRAFEPVMPVAPVETLHEVRIAGKHLRYTFELFADALSDDSKELHGELVSAQEHLGALHDADLAIAFVDNFLADDSENEALRVYRAFLEQTVQRERQAAERAWVTLDDPAFGQRLAEAIAAL